MATKTKTTKKSLKDKFINELKDKKEDERLERVKANANLKEVILYTQSTCPYCNQMKDELTKEGVKYVEKEYTKFPQEWQTVAEMTQIPVFPTIEIDGDYIVPRRDFQQIPQGIQRIISLADPKRTSKPPVEKQMLESLKTLNYNMSTAFQNMDRTLRPLQEFITNIQKELAEEDNTQNNSVSEDKK